MRLTWCLVLAACATSKSGDVVGPFTGDVHTYYVDRILVPTSAAQGRDDGDDLDGDRTVDNQLGAATDALAYENDITMYDAEMIAAGVVRARVEIRADDPMNDPTVGVTLFGSEQDTTAVEVGGTLLGGVFRSNRTYGGEALGRTTLPVPALADADPTPVEIQFMETDLTPDGHGGYDALVRGLVGPEVIDDAARSLAQMLAANPSDHPQAIQLFDPDHTGAVDAASLAQTPALQSLLAPDLTRDGKSYLSFGLRLHLSPTPPAGLAQPSCHDRIRDGNESDVDCGDGCLACAASLSCGNEGDCQSRACNSGTCGPVSCHDGARDGLESDIDCGGWQCAACASGGSCGEDADCASGHCLATHVCE